ncbi:MAG: hypothetical protein JNL11_05325 [Bdellovibrionaceae bacterium]|nr:hypothetical protein [Pseudobdellovibrionaceae bacterium]
MRFFISIVIALSVGPISWGHGDHRPTSAPKVIELKVEPKEQSEQNQTLKTANTDPMFEVIGPAQDGSRLIKFLGGYDTVSFATKLTCGPSFCVSCQKGCSLRKESAGCRFCSTGRLPFDGSIEAKEIAQQVEVAMSVSNEHEAPRFRVVFAGMGDSSYNAEGVVGAMELIQKKHPNQEIDFVIATVGSPIDKFRHLQNTVLKAFEDGKLKKGTRIYPQLSLHSSDDKKRGFLIPPAKDMTVKQVIEEGVSFVEKLRPWVGQNVSEAGYPDNLRLTLNYLMMGGLGRQFDGNATQDDLNKLESLVKEIGPNDLIVRLSAYNPDRKDGGYQFEVAPSEVYQEWAAHLRKEGISVRIFQSEATEIRGGCGQMVNTKWDSPANKKAAMCLHFYKMGSGVCATP